MIKKVCFLRNAVRMAFVAVAVMVSTVVSAQTQYQLPDPSFEDWTGAQFNSNIQPKYWNYSNVEQNPFGSPIRFNFAQRETGRNGGYAMKVQDQDLEVMGIGETSPGYIALGHPWAYLQGLEVSGATAGTYGGIAWTTRPDTMAVWIKRTGPHFQDENYNILFYSWVGTSQGGAYKSKDGGCNANVTAAYRVDEESDIRLALDGNECTVITPATQVAEGWIYEKREYPDWTLIKIPIYYFNDQIPEKCNVIFSASNYPNFRANSGLYAGNTLIVDDVELIYSSEITKVTVGGREWKDFDPKNHGVQTYALGVGASAIPAVEFYRGNGRLTNNRGQRANFSGRKLQGSEISVTPGVLDGTPMTVTVAAEDGSGTSTYQIQFVAEPSHNAYLSGISVNGEPIGSFNKYVTSYNHALPYGTTAAPVVTVEAEDSNSDIQITQASSTTGTATVVVTAQDGTTVQTYTIHFSVAQLSDNTLQSILIDGTPLPGFVPSKGSYTVSLPLGTTTAPTVTWVSAYPAGAQQITLLKNTLTDGCQIQVSVPGAVSKTYKLTYRIEASSYSYLGGIALDGEALDGFDPETFSYNITLPMGTTTLPAITWTEGDPYQTVSKTEGGVEGTTRIVVTAAAGNTTTYRLNFSVEKSSNVALAGIAIDGEALANFHADTLNYTITLPAGTTALPEVTYTQGDAYQTITKNINAAQQQVRIVVKAGDGSQRVYTVTFVVEKSANALLQMIYLDGDSLKDFEPETMNYTVALDEEVIPVITVDYAEGQTIVITSTSGFGVAHILVTPEEGSANQYSITFKSSVVVELPEFPTDSLKASTDALLSGIMVGEEALAGFRADSMDYTVVLPNTVDELPAIVPMISGLQVATVEYVDTATVSILVQASLNDLAHTSAYIIHFVPARSENSALELIDVDGAPFDFDPAVLEYTVVIPYGSTVIPAISFEKGDQQQTVAVSTDGWDATVLVTAGDSIHTTTYAMHFEVAKSTAPNVLASIVLDGIGVLDMNDGPDFVINLPYGADSLKVASMVKTFPEQDITVQEGGVIAPTVITVRSGRGDADMVYTLTPVVAPFPARLASISVNGQPVPGFDPDVTEYLMHVTDVPVVTYTTFSEDVEVEADPFPKFWKATVIVSDTLTRDYTVRFHYLNDTIPNWNFSQWTKAVNNNAAKPVAWTVPADIAKSFRGVSTYTFGGEVKNQGDTTVHLSTVSGTWSLGGPFPGMITLGDMAISPAVANQTSSTVSGGIQFRNSPDVLQVRYRPVKKNNIENIRIVATFQGNGYKQYVFTDNNYDNKWRVANIPLTDGQVTSPTEMNLILNAAHSELASALVEGIMGNGSSEMDVDWVKFGYISELKGLLLEGDTVLLPEPEPETEAPAREAAASNHWDLTLSNSEIIGLPKIQFFGDVDDYVQQIHWSDEVAGVRTATIRNFAEDSTYTDYTLTLTRPLSTVVDYEYVLNGRDLSFKRGSYYQTIDVQENDTAYIVTVTAESGAIRRDTILLPTGDVPAPTHHESEPQFPSFRRPAQTQVQYPTTLSSNTNLTDFRINGVTIENFETTQHEYALTLAEVIDAACTAEDENAKTQIVCVKQDETHYGVYAHVTAQDGSTAVYGAEVTIRVFGSTALLAEIKQDGALIEGFDANTFNYTITLPAGSVLPMLTATTQNAASVETQMSQNGLTSTVVYEVTSEDKQATNTYTVVLNVLPYDICTLSMLYVAEEELADFDPEVVTYQVELPYGTTSLPEVSYQKAQQDETVVVTSAEWTTSVVVTAQDGVTSKTYTVNFTVAKSTNANLSSLSVDGTPVVGFDAEQLEYVVTLPYGYMCVPEVRYETEDAAATAVLNAPDQSVATVTVTAEDGETSKTYTIHYTIAKSTNAELDMIYVNGDSLAGYDKEEMEYTCTYAYGAAMPTVTYTVGDEQQTVVMTTAENVVTLTVTAGDGETVNEYVLTFVEQLSDNNYLSDLQLNGKTVAGFRRDSMEYLIEYPVGTTESELLTKEDVVATPEEADAVVVVNEDANHTLTIIVTAPNGDVRPYVVHQEILLSGEARLKMIYLNDVALADFNPDVFEYEFIIPIRATAPEATAEAMDERAKVEYGVQTEEEGGSFIEIDGVAEDGTTITYTVHFVEANWSPSPDVTADDYLFLPIGGGQYKAVTTGLNVKVGIYDQAGRLVTIGDVPVADVNDVVVEVNADGHKQLVAALPSANGYVFTATPGQPYFYVFYSLDKVKRVAKGGKFMIVR